MKKYIYSLAFFLSMLGVSNVNGAFDSDSDSDSSLEEVVRKVPKATITTCSLLEEALANLENIAKKGFLKRTTKSREGEWKSISNHDPASFGLGFIAPIKQKGKALKLKPLTVMATSTSSAAILPDSYDVRQHLHSDPGKWEKLWPVQDQKSHNSCVSNAITACTEFDWLVWNFEMYKEEKARKKSEGIDVAPFDTAKFIVPFSRLFLYYNARGGVANDNGISVTAGIGAFSGDRPVQPAHYKTAPLYKQGCCKEEIWPYEKNYTEEPSDSAYVDAFNYQVHESAISDITFAKLEDTGDSYDTEKLNAIKKSLYISKRPVPFGLFFMGIEAVNNFRNLFEKNSTIITPQKPCSEYPDLKPGHSMLIVAYNDTAKLFTLRNSYGTVWGDTTMHEYTYKDKDDITHTNSFAYNAGYCYAPYDLILSDWAMDFWVMSRRGGL